ncbi:uncharacterized protein EI97DRAFT_436427 [Westerdykella ornata]|uniref:Uncharacterized protein n=1 Tax=Westerdykella ornata TaxID=318751 RepID=A0A6A6J8U9_WESOR|nr:uncharacterized protein EI97DRAFT_436427 [Westerdykella ornata]KAF2272991.1 hypothetical protein EI97DRAFT_436427 [Westerdykella ornata]
MRNPIIFCYPNPINAIHYNTHIHANANLRSIRRPLQPLPNPSRPSLRPRPHMYPPRRAHPRLGRRLRNPLFSSYTNNFNTDTNPNLRPPRLPLQPLHPPPRPPLRPRPHMHPARPPSPRCGRRVRYPTFHDTDTDTDKNNYITTSVHASTDSRQRRRFLRPSYPPIATALRTGSDLRARGAWETGGCGEV